MPIPRMRDVIGYATYRTGLATVAVLAVASGSGCEHAAHVPEGGPQSHIATLKTLNWRADTVFAHQRCSPPPGTSAPPSSDTALIAPGGYALELVATTGSRHGVAAVGHLVLNEARPTDRSPRTGQVAYDWPDGSTYLYGATDLNFAAVAAPMDEPCRLGAPASECGDPSVPSPTSEDPVFPGVLVNREAIPPPRVGRPSTLLIGTVGNARLHQVVLDGAGIWLTTSRIDAEGFSGWWRPGGIVVDGAGYFCALRVDDRHGGPMLP